MNSCDIRIMPLQCSLARHTGAYKGPSCSHKLAHYSHYPQTFHHFREKNSTMAADVLTILDSIPEIFLNKLAVFQRNSMKIFLQTLKSSVLFHMENVRLFGLLCVYVCSPGSICVCSSPSKHLHLYLTQLQLQMTFRNFSFS